ncbi:MAG TPA: type II toxin-antitoxin system HigB family toxin [Tepidisphaeraceae bacterium]|nr:type II toxin-antitoxin system HigB family toxin [Tepidisphaeraceae bacterium]
MELANLAAVERFTRKHRDAAKWLSNWVDVAKSADWRSIQDVRRQFPSADGVTIKSGGVVTVFNVRGNQYRLLVLIAYESQRIIIMDVMTHAEYNKEKWK